MIVKKYKMLQKEGIGLPYPFTQALFDRKDMKVVYLSKAEIDQMVKELSRTIQSPTIDVEEDLVIEEEVDEPEPVVEEAPKPPRPKINEKRVAAFKAKEVAAQEAREDELDKA
jgi:hypothetical protein